jgi:hypothetical protein
MKVGITSLLVLTVLAATVAAQPGRHILFGDIKVDEREASGTAMATFQVLPTAGTGFSICRMVVMSWW